MDDVKRGWKWTLSQNGFFGGHNNAYGRKGGLCNMFSDKKGVDIERCSIIPHNWQTLLGQTHPYHLLSSLFAQPRPNLTTENKYKREAGEQQSWECTGFGIEHESPSNRRMNQAPTLLPVFSQLRNKIDVKALWVGILIKLDTRHAPTVPGYYLEVLSQLQRKKWLLNYYIVYEYFLLAGTKYHKSVKK